MFWATLPRDNDEGRGAILIFDRDRLISRYRVGPRSDSEFVDEQEEAIWGRVVPLSFALLGYIAVPGSGSDAWCSVSVPDMTKHANRKA